MPEVKFYSFTSDGKEEVDLDLPLATPYILTPTHGVKILCHGWNGDVSTEWYTNASEAYLHSGEKNVIAIDWGFYANQKYPEAVEDVFNVGKFVGEKVLALHQATEIPLDQFHLIGHSLGAHVMGMVGQYIVKNSGKKVGRITGLDPAGPLFDREDNEYRLSADDAYFVDAIHTNTIFLGYKSAIGHVDFWPNGGRDQTGCNGDLSCSHNIAPQFFAESINSTNFPAWYCDSDELFTAGECFDNLMIYMGDLTPSNIRGEFFLSTNADSPYGKQLEDYERP